MGVTRSQRAYLKCLVDWKSVWEVQHMLGRPTHLMANGIVDKALIKLREAGLLEHHFGNGTYRLTDSGRAAIGPKP